MSDYEEFELRVADAPDLAFAGRKLATVADSTEPPWTEMSLYRTKSGQYVYHEVQMAFKNEPEKHKGYVANSWGDLVEYLGYSDLAKQLYEQAGLPRHAWVRRI